MDFPDSDIDLVCLFPSIFQKESHFLHLLPQHLSSLPQVQHLIPIRNSFLPLVRCQYEGVSLDLLFVSLDTEEPRSLPRDILSRIITKPLTRQMVKYDPQ